MSRLHAPMPSQAKAVHPLAQRQCTSCRQARGPCPDCAKKQRSLSAAPAPARLQVSNPGDAGEREAERAAEAVMAGRSAQVATQSPAALLQRQDDGTTAAAPTAPATEATPLPVPLGAPAGDTPPATAGAPATSTATCAPSAFSRPDYLTQPNTSTGDFGMTRLDGSTVTMPSVTTTAAGRGRVRIAPTTAALGTIPSVFTGAGTFTEGTAHFIDQDGTTGCASGRMPLRWTITADGADKIREGEQEHCADFQLAFDLSLRRFADAVNALAASPTTFASQASAERAVARRTSVAPADWLGVFNCLARKTLLRDRHNEHTPRPTQRPPRLADSCAFARMLVTARSLPRVGQTPSSSIVQGCGERGASASGTGGGSGSTPAPVAKPETAGQAPDAPGASWRDDDALVQRSPQAMEGDGRTPHDHDAHVWRVLAASGRPLDTGVRGVMESRFSRDFSQVRIHDDASAAGSAQALQANAYTVGRDIVFNHGRYAPDSQAGLHLLAHELAHVVQQSALPLAGGPLQRLIQRQPTSLGAIPEAERRAIQVGTIAVTVPPARITAFFTIMRSGRPSESRSIGATNSFDPAIPAALHVGLGSIAAYIAGDTNALPPDSSVEVDLDLSAHGGARTTYRLTRFSHTTGTGRSASTSEVMLIEQLGATPAAAAAQTVPGSSAFAVGSGNFSLGGNWTDPDYTTLHQALTLLPGASLTAAAGLTFRRMAGGSGPEAGHYDSGSDTVELNDRAFPAGSDLRIGQQSTAVRAVLHEVGHAIDLRVLERAWQAYDSAGQTPAARRTLLAVRSPSGSRWGAATGGNDQIQERAGDQSPAFRAAVRRDGVRRDTSGTRTTPEGTTATLGGGITTYADTDYQELYAESFAMYVAARDTLRLLRPATFAYFQARFP